MSECDEWEGMICPSTGYGIKKILGRRYGVHRLVMMQEVGHLNSDQFVCHTCDNRKCINIEHLFIGSHAENARDMCKKVRQHQQVKTECPQGHKYDLENTAIRPRKDGGLYRKCRKCERAKALRYYYKKKEQTA